MEGVSSLDFEGGQSGVVRVEPWQTDAGMSYWPHNKKKTHCNRVIFLRWSRSTVRKYDLCQVQMLLHLTSLCEKDRL